MVDDKICVSRDMAVLDGPGNVVCWNGVAVPVKFDQAVPAFVHAPLPQDASRVVGEKAQSVAVGGAELRVECLHVTAGQHKLTTQATVGHVGFFMVRPPPG